MNRELAMKIADAVMYEGYMLYPYRPSALKNRQRWTFGTLYPPDYEEVRIGVERSSMHSECLLKTNGACHLSTQLRFLHSVGKASVITHASNFACEVHERWDEAVPHSVEFEPDLNIAKPQQFGFSFLGSTTVSESLSGGKMLGTQEHGHGLLTVLTERLTHSLLKVSIHVENRSQSSAIERDRKRVLSRAMLSAHLILSTTNGELISLLDPPEEFRPYVSACNNIGNFPVLLGVSGEHDMMLCSPIILYDYPQVAPESAGDFYDLTEMDEMLTLRVMTLTDEEKLQIHSGGDHARALLERTEQSAREQLRKTHGAIRNQRYLRQSE